MSGGRQPFGLPIFFVWNVLPRLSILSLVRLVKAWSRAS